MEEHETKSLKNIVGIDTHENCEVKENIGETEEEVYYSNANGKLLVNNGQAPRNLVKYEKNFNEEQKLCAIIKDT